MIGNFATVLIRLTEMYSLQACNQINSIRLYPLLNNKIRLEKVCFRYVKLRKAERLDDLHHSSGILLCSVQQDVNVFCVTRFAMQTDSPSTDDKVLNLVLVQQLDKF